MVFNTDNIIRLLTAMTLAGLLFSIGLRLTWGEIAAALRQNRLRWVLPVNFLFVPVLVVVLIWSFQISTDIAVAMLLLAAAPFAPVVPTFTRLAWGDLALAGVLTALFPFLSSFLTPLICELSLKTLSGIQSLKFNGISILVTLVSTITLPLALGTTVHHYFPAVARWLSKPVQVFSEATGAIALAFVTITEFHTIRLIGWKPLLAMTLSGELSFLVGYLMSGPAPAGRLVVALGTANRNIALALLVAVESFPNTPIVAAVVANGLLLILFGLLHVGVWRFFSRPRAALESPPADAT